MSTYTPSPADQAKIDAVAKILGTDPADSDATAAALSALYGEAPASSTPAPGEIAAVKRQLSAREVAMCNELKVSPVAYLAMKRTKSVGRR